RSLWARRTLAGAKSAAVSTVPASRSWLTAQTRFVLPEFATTSTPTATDTATSSTPATSRRSSQLGVRTRRGVGELGTTGTHGALRRAPVRTLSAPLWKTQIAVDGTASAEDALCQTGRDSRQLHASEGNHPLWPATGS